VLHQGFTLTQGAVPRVMTADPMADLSHPVTAIHAKRAAVPLQHGALVGLTGIDGAGKAYFTHFLLHRLQQMEMCAAASARPRVGPPCDHFRIGHHLIIQQQQGHIGKLLE
jgi:hypothetical protein